MIEVFRLYRFRLGVNKVFYNPSLFSGKGDTTIDKFVEFFCKLHMGIKSQSNAYSRLSKGITLDR